MTRLQQGAVVLVIRAATPELAYTAALGAIEGGVRYVEITFTVPDAADVVRRLAALDRPGVELGIGTVLTPDQAREGVAAGARFLVAPNTSPDVVEAAVAAGVPIYPGALTPTEIRRAHELGAAAVKVFPAHALGGPAYIRELRGPYPDIPFMVSGGVTAETAPAYFAAGADSVCLGRELADPAEVEAGDVEAIARRSRDVLARIAAASAGVVR